MYSETPDAPDAEEGRAEPTPAARLAAAGELECERPAAVAFALGVLGGVWLAFGVNLLLIATTDSRVGLGPGRLLGGLAFALGPLLALLTGAELFGARPLQILAWLSGHTSAGLLFRNAVAVWAGNFVGALGAAVLLYLCAQYLLDGSSVGTATVGAASAKCQMPFGVALVRGLLGGALVCLAGWLFAQAGSGAERLIAATAPFVALSAGGFEYCATTMHLVPLGLLVKGAVGIVDPSLSVWRMIWGNLIPVTIGNGLGVVVTAALVHWAVHTAPTRGHRRRESRASGEAPYRRMR